MRYFNNILYVSHGTTNETEGLKQAVALARNNKAVLKILVVCPEFPRNMPEYRKKYEESLLEQARTSFGTVKDALRLEGDDVDVSFELTSGEHPSIRIIQHVLRDGHNLVVKEAEVSDHGAGFKAIDMTLLRKCPCPVWLCRPIRHSRQNIHVAVAIDPESEEEAAHMLSRRMLQLSRSLADSCSGELHIVSCWDYEFEGFLRHNPWAKTDEDTLTKVVFDAKNRHRATLDGLIEEAGIAGTQLIHHLRGEPEKLIPSFVKDKKIDILVMGTVARTGIPGLLIGNTAENIVQEITCSLMALKPQGFISPVRVKA